MNPLSNDPSYIKILANKINNNPVVDLKPVSGGKQFSIRIDPLSTKYIDAICVESKWKKSDVIAALIQRGLFDLFDRLDVEKISEIKRSCGFEENANDK
jgi:hypothetical protein